MPWPPFVSRNGVLIAPSEACISIFNPAIYGAYGVYESMQVVNRLPFEREAHLKRLAHSASAIGFELPADLATMGRWIDDVIAACLSPDASLALAARPCGRGRPDGTLECTLRLFVIGAENGGEVAAYMWLQPPPVYPQEYYTGGATAITFEAQRYLPEAKSLNSLASFMAQRSARASRVHEGLLHHGGHFTEGSNSNLFAVLGGEVVTPPTGTVLSGVTRDIVIALAGRHGIVLREGRLPVSGLPGWEECFITSTSRHVMPITAIDGRPVGNGLVGPVARRMMALFEAYFEASTARSHR